jgi:osmotically-inducible protein OsmY
MEDNPKPVTDDEIRSRILEFFQAGPLVDCKEITVEVRDGHVTLSGAVDAVPEKRRAREIAETTPGVKDVTDAMEVRNFVERSDEELRNEIINALTRDAYVQSLPQLEIYVSDGEVRVEGACETWAEKKSISDAVWWTPGVRNVQMLVHPTEEEADLREGITAFENRESL